MLQYFHHRIKNLDIIQLNLKCINTYVRQLFLLDRVKFNCCKKFLQSVYAKIIINYYK